MSDPFIVTAEYNQDRARRLHAAMTALNADFTTQANAGRLPWDSQRMLAWKRWLANFGAWYASIGTTGVPDAISWGMSAVDTTLSDYERDLNGWRDWYARNFRTAPTGPAVQEHGGGGRPKPVPTWAWAALAIAGTFALGSLVKSWKA